MAMIEAITVLAVVEAQDRATSILGDMFGSIGRVADAFKAAGLASEESARLMDAGLLEGATAAERLSNAETKMAASQDEAWATSAKLRDAQIELAASLDAEGKATETTAAAQARLRQVQLDSTIAAGRLRDASAGLAVAQKEVKANTEATLVGLGTAANSMMVMGAATALTAGYSVKMAGDFQQQTQTLVSGAGVSQSALEGVRKTVLNMAVTTGTSTKELDDAFFAVNSRLGDVSKSTTTVGDAAEIAKVHMANLKTVAVAIASSMNAYAAQNLTAGQASNILGVAVERGGMSFQELASSLTTVLPKAQEAKLSFASVAAAVATMTASGQSAQQATVDLAHTISKVQSPTSQMLSTWNQLGLTQAQVANTLHGPGGLEAAMNLIAETAQSKVGPSGKVVIATMRESKDATAALSAMMTSMQPAAASLARELMNGTISYKDYTKESKLLTGAGYDQAHQFELLYGKANAFNDAIKAGKPGFSGFSDLLKSAYGDATSMQTALLLGGTATAKWTAITKEATAAGKNASSGIQGWSSLQGTLNQKLSQAKEAAQVMGITMGTALLPSVTSLVKTITPWIEGLARLIGQHQGLTKDLFAMGLALGGVGLALKIVLGFYNLFKDTKLMIEGITAVVKSWELATKAAAVAQWLWNAATEVGAVAMAVLTSPITIVIVAVLALIAVVVLMYNHFKWFHDFVNTVWAGLKEGAMGVWHALQAAFSGVMTAVSAVASFVSSAIGGMVSFLESAWSTISGGISEAWNGIAAFFEKWWPLLLVIFAPPIAALMAIWNHFHTQIIGTAEQVWGKIMNTLTTTWAQIKTLAQFAWEQIKTFIIQPLEWVWNRISAGWNQTVQQVQTLWRALSSVASSVWSQIKADIITPFSEAVSWLEGAASRIFNAISGPFTQALKWLEGVNSWFTNIGIEIVNGIINGVSSAASYLMNEMSNLANDALKAAKSFLGIGSPSKLMADEVGKWIPHGVALGVTAHTQTAIDAVKTMSNALPHAIGSQGAVNLGISGLGQAGTVYGGGLGLGVGAAGGGQVVNLNLDLRGAVVAGDKGMEDLTNKIGNVIATKMLPQGGVRFH